MTARTSGSIVRMLRPGSLSARLTWLWSFRGDVPPGQGGGGAGRASDFLSPNYKSNRRRPHGAGRSPSCWRGAGPSVAPGRRWGPRWIRGDSPRRERTDRIITHGRLEGQGAGARSGPATSEQAPAPARGRPRPCRGVTRPGRGCDRPASWHRKGGAARGRRDEAGRRPRGRRRLGGCVGGGFTRHARDFPRG